MSLFVLLFICTIFGVTISKKTLFMSSFHSVSPKINAVLWDVDGTLADSYNLGYTSTRRILEANGYAHISEEEYHAGTKLVTPRRMAWHATGNPDDSIGIYLGNQFDDLYVGLVDIHTAPFYPSLREIVLKLSNYDGVKQGALSNACGIYVKAVLKANDVSDKFTLQYGADDVPAAKPSALGLLKCCDDLGVDPLCSVYIGDSPSDGQAANAANMYSIGVTWGSHPIETLINNFDIIVKDPTELDLELNKWLSKYGKSSNEGGSVSQLNQKAVSWRSDVVNNENMNKFRTDNEFWNT